MKRLEDMPAILSFARGFEIAKPKQTYSAKDLAKKIYAENHEKIINKIIAYLKKDDCPDAVSVAMIGAGIKQTQSTVSFHINKLGKPPERDALSDAGRWVWNKKALLIFLEKSKK